MKSKTGLCYLLSALIGVGLFGCSKTDDPILSPTAQILQVTARPADNSPDIVISWTPAQAMGGSRLTYTVLYGDRRVENLTDTIYTLRNVGYNTTVIGTVIAHNGKQASGQASFRATSKANPYVLIPDINFEKALISLQIDDVQDGQLLIANAQAVQSLNIASKGIRSLQGIEAFSSLHLLYCSANELTSLDLSNNKGLDTLSCFQNPLTSLNIRQNAALLNLVCYNTRLKELDVSHNRALLQLDCSSNQLTSLDVSKNKSLINLMCFTNQLSRLDLSGTTQLTYLDCQNNQLQSLDFRKVDAISYIRCAHNHLTSLDLKANRELAYLYCHDNAIETICLADLSQVTSNWTKDASATYQVCP
ncbi:leucine-rich repeat domain-containing protein [Spirosoma gilvum]